MVKLIRSDSKHPDFIGLVALLDADLAERDGDETAFYAQFNGSTHLNHTVICYQDAMAVGCGAFKTFTEDTVEIKRMYVHPTTRGKGFASLVLKELEQWAKMLGYTACVLETGLRQPEAIALYKKNGYQSIPNYPPYAGIANSVCFKKRL